MPVGTAAGLAARLARLAPAGRRLELAWNPEFLREGHGVHDTLSPDRIVAGVTSKRAEAALREVYAPQLAAGIEFFVTDLATAELAKVAANAFLATKISFINAVAEVCDAAGANVTMLADILGADPRIGAACLRPGLGFGGGCLPKDVRAFLARAEELGADDALKFLREVDAINLGRRTGMVNLACEALGGSVAGKAGRRARGGIQARLGRRARLPGAGCRADPARPRRGGHGVRPGRNGERAQGLAGAALCALGPGSGHRRGYRDAPDRLAGVHGDSTPISWPR